MREQLFGTHHTTPKAHDQYEHTPFYKTHEHHELFKYTPLYKTPNVCLLQVYVCVCARAC